MRAKSKFAVIVSLMLSSTASVSQPVPGTPSDTEGMYTHLKKARAIAGKDLFSYYAHRCLMDQTYRRTLSRGVQASGMIEPVKVFDNLYFVGQNAVSAWALKTSDGIVIFDTLNNPEEAKTYIVDGLVKLGLDPQTIKYVVITHSHGDHYNGAKYLHDTYGARLIASKIDWDVITRPAPARGGNAAPAAGRGEDNAASQAGGRGAGAPGRGNVAATPPRNLTPERDIEIADGQVFKVGDTELRFYVTPGHTPGTLSTIFKVTDNGRSHTVGFFGGLGTPASAADKKLHIASLQRFSGIAKTAGVDVLISNHQTQDQSIPKLEELRLRKPSDPNPYVLGNEAYLRYLDIQVECTLFAMAQQGQK